VTKRCVIQQKLLTAFVVPYELYELYDWGKVPELYGTIGLLHFTGQSVVVVDSSACSTHGLWVTPRIQWNGPLTMLKTLILFSV